MTLAEGIPHLLNGGALYRGTPGNKCMFMKLYDPGSPYSQIIFGIGWDMNRVQWLDRALNRQDLEVDDWAQVPGDTNAGAQG